MNKQRARKSVAKKLLSKPKGKFEQIDLSKSNFIPQGMTRAYKNNHYVVMVYDDSLMSNGVLATKAMVQRHDDNPLTRHWREMQSIKNEIFGDEVLAVEYYPPESELVNDKNIYWLWIIENQPRYKSIHKDK